MKESLYIISNRANCKYCYKCLRNCPVKAISFQNDVSFVIEDECILCGTCVNVCPQNAKNYRDDITKFESLINKPFIVSIAPSFYGNEDAPLKILSILKSLGAVYISETAVGAEFVTEEYIRIYENSNHSLITTSCPVIVNLIEKHYPHLIPYMMPIVSPAIAHSQFLNQLFGDLPKLFVGPCIAKKEELENYYDVVLTFEELEKFIKKREIIVNDYKERLPDFPYPKRTRFYPTSGGILFSAQQNTYNHLILEGVNNIIDFLEHFNENINEKVIIEMSACHGGCLNGPATDRNVNILEKRFKLNSVIKQINNTSIQPKYIDLKEYNFSLKKQFINKSKKVEISKEKIENILKSMEKDSPEKELNCSGCGYDTCVEKAKAVYLGKAEKDMCFAYLIEKVSSVSNKVVDESPNGILIFKDNDLLYINESAKKLFVNYEKERLIEICERIFNDPNRIHEIYINGKKFYFYPKAFSLPEDSGNVILLVDITELIIQKERMNELKSKTIEKIEEVLNNQMKLAQDIASILGESIAETKAHFLEFKKYMGEENADV